MKFTNENQPNHKRTGRKKDVLKGFVKNTEFSRNDIKRIIKDLLAKDKTEWESIVKDKEKHYPAPYADIAAILHKAAMKGDFDTYEKILDYGLGKEGDIIWRRKSDTA